MKPILLSFYVIATIALLAFTMVTLSMGSRAVSARDDAQVFAGAVLLLATLFIDLMGAHLLFKGFRNALRP